MRHSIHTLLSALLVLTITACSSDDIADDSNNNTTVKLPANATVITLENALDSSQVALAQFSVFEAFDSLIAPQQTVSPAVTITQDCPTSGSLSAVYNETENSKSGSATYDLCTFTISPITMSFDGSISFSESWTPESDYTDEVDGTLSILFDELIYDMSFEATENGNSITGEYTLDIRYSITGTFSGGFLIYSVEPITGNNLFDDVYSGIFIIEGAANTRLRLTVTATNVVSIELDQGTGSFVDTGEIILL